MRKRAVRLSTSFRAVRSGAGALESRDLHRDGGRSRDPPAAAEVLPEGAGHRDGVDAGMRPEAAVLENESRRDDSRGELFERPVSEIARFRGGHFAEKSSFAVEEQVTRPRTFEPRAREREPDDPESRPTSAAPAAILTERRFTFPSARFSHGLRPTVR